MRRAAWVVIAASLLGVAVAHGVERCGDDVDGHGTAVPCACGDLLVSSRTLSPADPITAAPCPGNGLLVTTDRAITLGLGGRLCLLYWKTGYPG